nr:hypothetical protein [Tanacetum cinerariifolium]
MPIKQGSGVNSKSYCSPVTSKFKNVASDDLRDVLSVLYLASAHLRNVHKTSHKFSKEKDCSVLTAKVARSLKEDLGGKLEVVAAVVEEKVKVGGREVKSDGVVFGVSRILLGVIPVDIMRESSGEAFGLEGGAD